MDVLPAGKLVLEDTGRHPELLDFEEWSPTGEGRLDVYVFTSRSARDTWLRQMIATTSVVYAKSWVVISFGFEGEVRNELGGDHRPLREALGS